MAAVTAMNLARRAMSSAAVELTSVRYPGLKRGQFAKVEQRDLDHFKAVLGPDGVLTDDLEGYNTDWLRTVRGECKVALRPKSTAEVSEILAHCNKRRIAVCPQGGNTGLVGGSVPVFDEVVVSTARMDQIECVDANSSVATVQSGVVLERLDSALRSEHGLMVPLDLGAKGSCHIGGNVSTNAGGLRLVRYGNLHGSVMGVEAVLADGRVLDCLSPLKKDNTGYDLKHLFIGSEGTLGLVTRVAIHCPPKPNAVNVAFLGLSDFDSVLKTFRKARTDLGEILSSCELMDAGSMDTVVGNLELKNPISENQFYLLIETSGSKPEHDSEKLSEFLDGVMGEGLVADGTVASSQTQIDQLWPLRERIAEGLLKDGYTYKYDISLPLEVFYECVTIMRERLGDKVIRCVGYGHVGDGNLHLNFTSADFDAGVLALIEPFVYEWTSKHRGSISAEHGLGFKKRNFMHFSKGAEAIAAMKQIKSLFDPNGIMNPYKVLPDK